jgi:hypothetical protein
MCRLYLGFVSVAVLGFTMAQSGSSSSRVDGFLLVANKGEHTLGIVDPGAGQ